MIELLLLIIVVIGISYYIGYKTAQASYKNIITENQLKLRELDLKIEMEKTKREREKTKRGK